MSTIMPAHFDLSPRTRHVRPQKLCCRERPAKLMLTTGVVDCDCAIGKWNRKFETRNEMARRKWIVFQFISRPTVFSLFSTFGNARAVRISSNRSQNDIQTNTEITHFWCVHLKLSAAQEGNSFGCRSRDRCGKIYFKMSNLPTFRRMRKNRKDYSDVRQQIRFVIVIIS